MNYQLLQQALLKQVDKNQESINDSNLRSMVAEINKTMGGNGLATFDAMLAVNPSMAESFNAKISARGLKGMLNFSELQVEENLRTIVETNAPCKVYGCTNVLMEFYKCNIGIHNYIKQIPVNSKCSIKVPFLPMQMGSTPKIPSGSSIGLATGLLEDTCIEVTPDKYGEYVSIDMSEIDCNSCVDRMILILEQLAQRMFNSRENATQTKILAIAQNVVTGASITEAIQDLSEAIKTKITTAGALTYFVAPATFDRVIRNYVDQAGNRLILPNQISCEGKCRTMCIDGNVFVELDTIPVTVAGETVMIAGYTEYAAAILSPVKTAECSDCLDRMNDIVKVGNVAYFEVLVPTQFADAWAKTTITL